MTLSSPDSTLFPLGSYTGTPDNSSSSGNAAFNNDYAEFSSVMGAQSHYLVTYIDYRQSIDNWLSNAGWGAASAGQNSVSSHMTPVIGFPLASILAGVASPDQQFQDFAAGQHDNVIKGVVDAWANQGYQNLDFRIGWEMNLQGPTYAGDSAQSQADWVLAFQHTATVLRAEAALDGISVNIIWNPGTVNYSNAQAVNNLYPGNQYVDTIGADVYSDMYPYSDATTPMFHNWHTGAESNTTADMIADPVNREHYWSYPAATKWAADSSGGHSQSLSSLIQFAEQQGKPFAVPETGAGNSNSGTDVSDDPAFPHWLANQLYVAQAQGEKISFVNIWDSNGGGNYKFSNISDAKPDESAAWSHFFGANSASIPVVKVTDYHGASALILPPTTGQSELFPDQSGFDQPVMQTVGKNGVVTLSTPLWNDVRIANIHDIQGGSWATNTFMEVDATLSGAVNGSLLLTSAKRGVVSLDNGNYTVTVNAHSNGADPVSNGVAQHLNDFVITAKSGNDTITLNGDGLLTHGVFNSGSGHSVFKGADGGNTVTFGSGRTEATGGSGADNYIYHQGSGVDIIQNFDRAHDSITLDHSLKSSMHMSTGVEGTTLAFGSSAHELVLHAISNFDTTSIHWV